MTKGKQWIKINKNVELLDTPGILWPKFEDQTIGMNLALIGSIKEEILNLQEMAIALIDYLTAEYPGVLNKRYEINEDTDRVGILEEIAQKRGCLLKGGNLDLDKACRILLDDFRSQNLGHISLEKPELA